MQVSIADEKSYTANIESKCYLSNETNYKCMWTRLVRYMYINILFLNTFKQVSRTKETLRHLFYANGTFANTRV